MIGTNAAGTAAIPNAEWGVFLGTGTQHHGRRQTPGSGNVISGNDQGGVAIYGINAVGDLVEGNMIGTDFSGTNALGNAYSGVYVGDWGYTGDGATDATIGGTAAGAGNVISANGNFGVWITGLGVSGNVVEGNEIAPISVARSPWATPKAASRSTRALATTRSAEPTPQVTSSPATSRRVSSSPDRRLQTTWSPTTRSVPMAQARRSPQRNLGRHHRSGARQPRGRNNRRYAKCHLRQRPGRHRDLWRAGRRRRGRGELHRWRRDGKPSVWKQLQRRLRRQRRRFLEWSAGLGILRDDRRYGGRAGNVISANGNFGVWISGAGATGNVVQGNMIGTDTSGTYAIGNGEDGVRIDSGAEGNTIGGSPRARPTPAPSPVIGITASRSRATTPRATLSKGT